MNSIWSETCQIPRLDSLPGDLVCDAAVIGAGMAGILIAAALQQAGCRTVVLEADRIGGGQTLITCCEDEHIASKTGGRVILISGGRVLG